MIQQNNSGNLADYASRPATANLRSLAHIFGIFFSPLLAPAYLFFILLIYFPAITGIMSSDQKIEALISITLATCLLPFVLVFILFKTKKIKTLTLDNKKDRFIPQLFSCFNYILITFFLAYAFGFPNGLTQAMVANTLSLTIITLVTPYWKISTHACGAFGVLSVCTALYLRYHSPEFTTPYSIILFLAIAICASRLYLKVHSPLQIIGGSVLGGVIGFLLFL